MSFVQRTLQNVKSSFRSMVPFTANQQSLLAKYMAQWDSVDTSTGGIVNVSTGLRQDTVYTAIKRLADAVAMTPCPVFQRLDRGRDRSYEHPVHRVLNIQANKDLTAYTWKHMTTVHLSGWGNAFSHIERDNAGRITALVPMFPDDVKVEGRSADGLLVYSWSNKEGEKFLLRAGDILHIRGLTFDGVMGISPIMQLRQLIGRAAVREEYQARFYSNGALLGGVVNIPDGLSDEQLERHKKSFREQYSGARNAGKILLLEGQATFNAIGVNPRDAQFIETGRLDNAKIAAIFGVPLQFINETATTTRATADQMFREFLTLGLNTLFSNIESQLIVSLFTPEEQKTYYCEFNRESLIQADFAALIEGLKSQVQGTLLTPNQARAKLNLNPEPDGDHCCPKQDRVVMSVIDTEGFRS